MKGRYYLRKFLREEHLPTKFCPGCGLGIVMNLFLKAVDESGYKELSGKFVFVSGIGCSAWIPSPYFKADSIHVTHGRSIPVATGIKLAKPELKVVVFGGDGDLAGIGLHHLIFAAHRNVELTVIMCNNMTYAMTGGQAAPTTPYGVKTVTTPYGKISKELDISKILVDAGSSYVARWTTAHPIQLKKSFKKALETNGFSFVEVYSQCPTRFGKELNMFKPVEMMEWFKRNSKVLKKGETIENGEMKLVLGEFVERKRPGYCELYYRNILGEELEKWR